MKLIGPYEWMLSQARGGFILLVLLCSGCISDPKLPVTAQAPALAVTSAGPAFVSEDGRALPYTYWQAAEAKAIIIALHGMNDYAHGFERAGHYWASRGISVYAYDQRSFGRARIPPHDTDENSWPGTKALTRDLAMVVSLVRAQHPSVPVYVLGHSMGGAVVMIANADQGLDVDGVILAAPAIWGGARMPIFYRLTLSIAATMAPGKTLTGARAQRQATDNIPVLRAMQKDPNVLKQTPLRSISGLVRLMGKANSQADHQKTDILFLIGCKDQMVPVSDQLAVAKKISARQAFSTQIAPYRDGWHLLFRDLQAENVWSDVATWIDQHNAGRAAGSADPAEDGAAQQVIWSHSATPSCSGSL